MSDLDKLVQYFEKFPGIGARQAKRFAFHILTLPENDRNKLANLIATLNTTVIECDSCHRYFTKNGGTGLSCNICQDSNRDHSKLLIVERDNDITPIERAGVYDGLYFVLGGNVPLLNNTDDIRVRSGALKALIESRLDELTETILGFSVNPDGENTARFVEQLLHPFQEKRKFQISYLGRGLSTGSELEYADPETIKNALNNRH